MASSPADGSIVRTGRRAGVLGKPIRHSLSPVIHNAGYAARSLTDWSYTAHECDESELGAFVAALGPQWAGLSLTMPLKEVALDVADEVASLAATIGAANTLVRLADGTWRAENTDAPGMVNALRGAGIGAVQTVAVLGAGGTARAAMAAARELGAASITVYARRMEAIEALAPVGAGVTLIGMGWSHAPAAAEADVVISTVPHSVADSLVGSARWRSDGVLFDVVYDPWPTVLAESAARAGCTIVSGLDLLLAQAALQFELFTGVDAPIAAMRTAVRQARKDALLADPV